MTTLTSQFSMTRLKNLVLLLCSVIFLSSCARAGGEPANYTANKLIPLHQGDLVSQTVNPAGTILKAVDFQVLETDDSPMPYGVVTLDVIADGKVLGSAYGSTEELQEGWNNLTFTPAVPIPDVISLVWTYEGDTQLLLSANVTPAETDPNEHPEHDVYEKGEAFFNGESINGDMTFIIHGDESFSSLIKQYKKALKDWAKRMINQPIFTAVWLALFVSAALLAIRGLISRDDAVSLT